MTNKNVYLLMDLCCAAVDKMTDHIESRSHDWTNGDPETFLDKVFYVLGAAVGNMIYTYQETFSRPQVMHSFLEGMNGYISHCSESDALEFDNDSKYLSTWLAGNWTVDKDEYKH